MRARVDGTVAANTTASIHRKIAGDHGFAMHLDCALFASGKHKVTVSALYQGSWAELDTALCTTSSPLKATKCPVERRML